MLDLNEMSPAQLRAEVQHLWQEVAAREAGAVPAPLNAHNPTQVDTVAIERLCRLLPYERATILIYNHDHTQLQVLATSSAHPDPLIIRLLLALINGHWDQELQRRQPWRVADVLDKPELAKHADEIVRRGVRSFLFTTLRGQGEEIGALMLSSSTPQTSPDEHTALLEEIASQLAIGLQSTRLLAQLEQERALLARQVAGRNERYPES